MNPLPPQAYTKETMLKAYAWVMNQPPSIKELATTPDILVSLYLKAQRDGLDSLDRPSIQNFREELKSLAGMMSTLSSSQQTTTPSGSSPAAPSAFSQGAPSGFSSGASSALTTEAPMIPPQDAQHHTRPTSPGGPPSASSTSSTLTGAPTPQNASTTMNHSGLGSSKFSLEGLDERSLSMIREVKRGLNLSNDMDSLRALVQLGFQALRDKIPRD